MEARHRATHGYLYNIGNTVRHIYNWVTAPSIDRVYKNPNYIEIEGSKGDVIYCVHGTGDSSNSFKFIKNQLLPLLPSHIAAVRLIVFDYSEAFLPDIENFATQLCQKMITNDDLNVYLMGHSRGGIICAYLAEYLAANANINVKFTFAICSPFGSSPFAPSFFPGSIKQMSANGDLLPPLVEKMLANIKRYHFYVGDRDIISPLYSSFLSKHPEALTIFNEHDHLSIMGSQRLIESIALHLSGKAELSLATAIHEISEYLEELKPKPHLASANQKITLLEKLLENLRLMQHQPEGEYTINSIGDYIEKYMQHTNLENTKKPLDILKTSLNFPFSMFQLSDPTSANFITMLILRYRNVAIVSELDEQRLPGMENRI